MRRILSIAAAAALAWCAWPAAAQAQDDRLTVPVIYYTLENGLRVVLSEDHSAPTATVAVYYNDGQRNLHGLPDDFHDSYVRRIHAVSPAEVQRIAQTYLDPQKMVVVIVGDRAAIAEQVAPFGEIR